MGLFDKISLGSVAHQMSFFESRMSSITRLGSVRYESF